jgi:hypothetical protein
MCDVIVIIFCDALLEPYLLGTSEIFLPTRTRTVSTVPYHAYPVAFGLRVQSYRSTRAPVQTGTSKGAGHRALTWNFLLYAHARRCFLRLPRSVAKIFGHGPSSHRVVWFNAHLSSSGGRWSARGRSCLDVPISYCTLYPGYVPG